MNISSSTATGAVQAMILDSFVVGEELACLLAPCMYPLFCLAKYCYCPIRECVALSVGMVQMMVPINIGIGTKPRNRPPTTEISLCRAKYKTTKL